MTAAAAMASTAGARRTVPDQRAHMPPVRDDTPARRLTALAAGEHTDGRARRTARAAA